VKFQGVIAHNFFGFEFLDYPSSTVAKFSPGILAVENSPSEKVK